MVTAVVSCLRFYKILKAELVGRKPLSKLFAFKLMVGVNFLMTVSSLLSQSPSPRPSLFFFLFFLFKRKWGDGHLS